jgi:hypothetical protein
LDNSCSCIDDFVYIKASQVSIKQLGSEQTGLKLRAGLRLGGQSLGLSLQTIEWIDSKTVRPYRCFTDTIEFTSVLYKSFCVLSLLLPTATDYAIPLPVRWPYPLYCLDDRAHRRHIHLISPQYANTDLIIE